jgi:hypothetical protein
VAPVTDLINEDTAVAHLRLGAWDDLPPEDQEDLSQKIDDATDTIVGYLKTQADPTWDVDTVPGEVRSAILLLLAHLWEHRGDDLAPVEYDAKVWEAIGRLLVRRRDPALA